MRKRREREEEEEEEGEGEWEVVRMGEEAEQRPRRPFSNPKVGSCYGERSRREIEEGGVGHG